MCCECLPLLEANGKAHGRPHFHSCRSRQDVYNAMRPGMDAGLPEERERGVCTMKALVVQERAGPFVMEERPDPVAGPGGGFARIIGCGMGLGCQHTRE